MSFASLSLTLQAVTASADSSAAALGRLSEAAGKVRASVAEANLEQLGGQVDAAQTKVDKLLAQLAALLTEGDQFLRSDLIRSALGDLIAKAEAGKLSVEELMKASDALLANISDGRVYLRMKALLDLLRQIIAAQEKVAGGDPRRGRSPLDELGDAARRTR